jgi:hypothetical protein
MSRNATIGGTLGVTGTSTLSTLNSAITTVKGPGTAGTVAFKVTDSANAIALSITDNGVVNTGNLASSPYNLTSGAAANIYLHTDFQLYRSTSSSRYKENISYDGIGGLADVLKLKPASFQDKTRVGPDHPTHLGFIAEDVAEVEPRLVQFTAEGDPDALSYDRITALLVNAVKELDSRIPKKKRKKT